MVKESTVQLHLSSDKMYVSKYLSGHPSHDFTKILKFCLNFLDTTELLWFFSLCSQILQGIRIKDFCLSSCKLRANVNISQLCSTVLNA